MSIATLKSEPTPRTGAGLQHAIECARVALDNKAQNILLLDLRAITPLYDFLVLATGASRRQIHNLAEEIDAAMRERSQKRLSIEGYQSARWVVQDYGDIVVHIFDADTRAYYGLEDLWADAPQLDWQRL
ncbi:MAG TPA: ribosome silencing factor [Gemmataceae bacterium]|nr:ribosome silencing factor [Gemmataceae bacterium]